ncbi:MAG: ABC transporter ATP-binding protein [Thermoanaerobaculia bacterium]|nr:ABC transporter ATP-binding protein [Thermoanaerobaculia bacterium]MCZ7650969.1 ABC transporter ATP-binding protein [Thermoanaerobaculia bacterium]
MSVEVRARALTKSYRDGERSVEVLRGVGLDVAPGELVAIEGPSGSGKSTLLHVVGGLDRPDAGELAVGGRSLVGLDPAELARFRSRTVGFVFQFYQLLADFTAAENVLMPARIARLPLGPWRRRAAELLAAVGLADRAAHFPGQLSGGEQQRVALCRALLLEPPLLLADEPTGNLDPASGEQVFALLLDLVRAQGTTCLLVTHNPEMARRCARVLALQNGVLNELSR